MHSCLPEKGSATGRGARRRVYNKRCSTTAHISEKAGCPEFYFNALKYKPDRFICIIPYI